MNLLLLETATSVCSVALAQDVQVSHEIHSDEPNAHSSRLNLFMRDLLRQAGMRLADVGAVCVSQGPGSYTGLRIGASSAKGICYALGVPLVTVPTLQGMAQGYYLAHPDYNGLVCPMIDARRMECYAAIYDRDMTLRKPVGADVVVEGIYSEWLDEGPVTFVGEGAPKTRDMLGHHPNARFDGGFRISAAFLLPEALRRLREGHTEDVAYFEPFYLKDFVAKKSVVHGLRD